MGGMEGLTSSRVCVCRRAEKRGEPAHCGSQESSFGVGVASQTTGLTEILLMSCAPHIRPHDGEVCRRYCLSTAITDGDVLWNFLCVSTRSN